MPTWKQIWRLARFNFWLYLASGLLASNLFYLFPLMPGLIIRRIFDSLTGDAPAASNLWGLVALLVGVTIARVTAMTAAARMFVRTPEMQRLWHGETSD